MTARERLLRTIFQVVGDANRDVPQNSILPHLSVEDRALFDGNLVVLENEFYLTRGQEKVLLTDFGRTVGRRLLEGRDAPALSDGWDVLLVEIIRLATRERATDPTQVEVDYTTIGLHQRFSAIRSRIGPLIGEMNDAGFLAMVYQRAEMTQLTHRGTSVAWALLERENRRNRSADE